MKRLDSMTDGYESGDLDVVAVEGFGFFFFQAEDGIRDWSVTGVQTCALPICRTARRIAGRLGAQCDQQHVAAVALGELAERHITGRRVALGDQGGAGVRAEEIGRASCRERV